MILCIVALFFIFSLIFCYAYIYIHILLLIFNDSQSYDVIFPREGGEKKEEWVTSQQQFSVEEYWEITSVERSDI